MGTHPGLSTKACPRPSSCHPPPSCHQLHGHTSRLLRALPSEAVQQLSHNSWWKAPCSALKAMTFLFVLGVQGHQMPRPAQCHPWLRAENKMPALVLSNARGCLATAWPAVSHRVTKEKGSGKQVGSGGLQRPGDGLPSGISGLQTARAATPSFQADPWLPQQLTSGTLRCSLGGGWVSAFRPAAPATRSASLTFSLLVCAQEIMAGSAHAVRGPAFGEAWIDVG